LCTAQRAIHKGPYVAYGGRPRTLASAAVQSNDRAQRSRHRLTHLAGEARTEPVVEDEAASVPGPLPPPRNWRDRWLPARWHGARLDPGRHGALALAAVAAVAAVIAATGVWRDRPVPQPVPPLPAMSLAPLPGGPTAGAAPSSTAAAPTMLVVSVAGKVRAPGLVTVPNGARVADALAVAGGAVPGTDLLALNLAQPVSDGQQILVGVAPPPGTAPVSGAPPGASTSPVGSQAAGGKVNLNSATAAELEALPGVGPVMTKAILDHRTKSGNFRTVDQLSDVSGIGPARLAQLRDLVTV